MADFIPSNEKCAFHVAGINVCDWTRASGGDFGGKRQLSRGWINFFISRSYRRQVWPLYVEERLILINGKQKIFQNTPSVTKNWEDAAWDGDEPTI